MVRVPLFKKLLNVLNSITNGFFVYTTSVAYTIEVFDRKFTTVEYTSVWSLTYNCNLWSQLRLEFTIVIFLRYWYDTMVVSYASSSVIYDCSNVFSAGPHSWQATYFCQINKFCLGTSLSATRVKRSAFFFLLWENNFLWGSPSCGFLGEPLILWEFCFSLGRELSESLKSWNNGDRLFSRNKTGKHFYFCSELGCQYQIYLIANLGKDLGIFIV